MINKHETMYLNVIVLTRLKVKLKEDSIPSKKEKVFYNEPVVNDCNMVMKYTRIFW